MSKKDENNKDGQPKSLEDTILPTPSLPTEEAAPAGFATPKELEQAEQIRQLQIQNANVMRVVDKLVRKTGVKDSVEEENGDFFGFIRALEGDPITGWKMLPGSYVSLDQQNNIDDKQFLMVYTVGNPTGQKMHYVEFDQRTKMSQIPCKILEYCVKNDLGEWRPKRYTPEQEHDIVLSTDNGKTYEGVQMKMKHCFLN